jgi:hypothetical protein
MSKNTHDILRQLVEKVTCKLDWEFGLEESEEEGLRLTILVPVYDSYYPKPRFIRVRNYFPVPTATYNEKTWRRWIFECCRGVENHELGEWFKVDGYRPFAPLHGPGEDPYTVHEFRDEVDARTVQDGSVIDSLVSK